MMQQKYLYSVKFLDTFETIFVYSLRIYEIKCFIYYRYISYVINKNFLIIGFDFETNAIFLKIAFIKQ